jgi:DNA-binding transcriptional LysR family regulator
MPDVIQLVLGVPVVTRIHALAPKARLALRRVSADQIDCLLQSGELDLALATNFALQPHWQNLKVIDERFVCMVRQGHPACDRSLDTDTYCQLEHLLVSTSGGGFTGIVDEVLARSGRTRKVVVSVEDFLIAAAIVEKTDLVATLPARLAASVSPNLQVLDPPLDVGGFTLHMVWHARSKADAAHRWLRQEIAAVAKEI